MENKNKSTIFFALTALMGAATTFAYLNINDNMLVLSAVIVAINLLFFFVLFFGLPLYKADISNYHTTTTKYYYNSYGEVESSVYTPEDKANSDTFWARVGLSFLCWFFSPLSHIVLIFYIGLKFCEYDHSITTKRRIIMIILGVLAIVLTALITYFLV